MTIASSIADKAAPASQGQLTSKGELPSVTPATGRLFVIYNGYRMLVGLSLLAVLILPATRQLVANFDGTLFGAGAAVLLMTALLLSGPLGGKVRASQTRVFGLLLVDITVIALVVGATGGILSGFSVLYLITVAAAATLLNERVLATFIAALAVLAVLMDTAWMVNRGEATLGMMVSAGLLGSLLFALSLLVQIMASRLAAAEAEATEAQATVQALQQLNEQIISHMETGILLADGTGAASCVNGAAQRLLGLAEGEATHLLNISPELANQYQEWRETEDDRPEPFRLADDGPTMVASFVSLNDNLNKDNLIFIEDYTPVTQFAQSLKLNSLSKLTASIAHEIRNPLGAISHAAQLLTESGTVEESDRLLCDILVSNSRRVSDIIDNVSEVSRREAPKPKIIELNNWLPDYLDEYQSLHQRPCEIVLRIQDDTGIFIAVDPEHFKRILANLFDNGLRHSEDEGDCSRLRLEVTLDSRGEQVLLDVVDFGLGVAEHNLTRLFEPFFTTSKQGSGLGLYLCKELCEINGARLAYRRTRLEESAFRVTIDRERSTL
ncbi:MAG: HAMP domain-containing histidine kinase [Luminiphilus sp.]|nr:HAMP domain-containing histidine kinase [Luminiphilus sp.]